MVAAKAHDKLYQLHKLDEEEIKFATMYYKTEQEPAFQNKMQEEFIKLQDYNLEFKR